MTTSGFARRFSIVCLLALCVLCALSSLEALLLRQSPTLASRFPKVLLGFSFVLAFVAVSALERPRDRRDFILLGIATVCSMLALMLCARISAAIPDTSWDGLAYHQPSIYELRAGWNPTVESKDGTIFSNFIWTNNYPKGAWLCSATLAGAFGDIQAAKLTFFLALAAFAFLLVVLKEVGVPPVIRTACAVVLVLNPVAICQAWQFYVDGVLYYVLLLMLSSAAAYGRERRVLDFVVMLSAALFAASIKFTGVLYAALIFCWLAIDTWATLPPASRWTRTMIVGLSVWVCALVVVGWSPYVQHVLKWQHPFYPLYGEGKVDIIAFMSPKAFRGHGWLWRLWYAHAEFDLLSAPTTAFFRQFSLAGGIGALSYDTIILGLGRLFIVMVALGAAACAVAIVRGVSRRTVVAWVAFGMLVFLNPAAWWPRYSPLLWALPIVMSLPTMRSCSTMVVERYLVAGVLFFAGMTSYLYCGQAYFEQREKGLREQSEVADLMVRVPKDRPVEVATADFGAYVYKLKDAGRSVRWVGLKDLSCPNPARFKTLLICPTR
jgi:hypothetical protein